MQRHKKKCLSLYKDDQTTIISIIF